MLELDDGDGFTKIMDAAFLNFSAALDN